MSDLSPFLFLSLSLSLSLSSFFFSTFTWIVDEDEEKRFAYFFLSLSLFFSPLSTARVLVYARKRKCMHFHRKRSAPLVRFTSADGFVVEFWRETSRRFLSRYPTLRSPSSVFGLSSSLLRLSSFLCLCQGCPHCRGSPPHPRASV